MRTSGQPCLNGTGERMSLGDWMKRHRGGMICIEGCKGVLVAEQRHEELDWLLDTANPRAG